jgi:hypothetical protein
MNAPSKNAAGEVKNSWTSRSAERSFEEATKLLFARLAHQSPPAPLRPAAPEPRDRYWPAQTGAEPLPGVTISLRHPACTFAFDDVEARKIGRSPRSPTQGRQSRLPSMKMARQMRANSGLEFDHLLDCELDSGVWKFVEQPAWLTYNCDGHQIRHKGDALLLTCVGLEWRETKYESDASLPENEARWPCTGHALASVGVSFRVITERHIREPVRWLNVKAIWENRMAPIPAEPDRIAIVKAIDAGTLKTISQLTTVYSLEMSTVLALVRRGFLAVDLSHPISGETIVRRGTGLRFPAGSKVYGQ